jgi:phosphoglycolate phosphatase-like HAD superfamily hydrolase
VAQSLVTGNIRPIAHEKLSAFGLGGWLDFEIAGYGSDGGARSMLVRLARERSEAKYGKAFAAKRVVVIGDTQHDIVGALDSGVVAIGVATGRTTADELTAAGAQVVLPSLADTAAVMHAVLGEAPTAPSLFGAAKDTDVAGGR